MPKKSATKKHTGPKKGSLNLQGEQRQRGQQSLKVYQIIVDQLLKAIESDEKMTWIMPWKKGWGTPRNPFSSHKGSKFAYYYTGKNFFILFIESMVRPFGGCPYWSSEKKILEAGGELIEGAIPSFILKPMKHKGTHKVMDRKTGDVSEEEYEWFTYAFTKVYNHSQTTLQWFDMMCVENPDLLLPESEYNPIPAAQAIWDAYPNRPEVREDRNCLQACYTHSPDFVTPDPDFIMMPAVEHFRGNAAEYWNTKFHEGSHATRHPSRVGFRKATQMKGVGDGILDQFSSYAIEEVIAETSAAFLCAEAGIEAEIMQNTMAYIKGWAKDLRENPAVLLEAFGDASRAAEYILGRSAKVAAEDTESDMEVAAV